MKEDFKKRTVISPDGKPIEIDPLKDYFSDAKPKVYKPAHPIIEKFANWARANSLWVLGFGTGCGAIEMRPLMTPRFDAYRYGIQWRPTPRQASVFVVSLPTIDCPFLTPKEKIHLDALVKADGTIGEEDNIGITRDDMDKYGVYYKYYPQFFESIY